MVFAGLFPTDSDDVPGAPRRTRAAEAERRRALLRAGDVERARLRVPLRLPRPAAHGDRPRAARARVRPRPARDRAERRVPRRRRERRVGRGAQPAEMPRELEVVEEPYIRASIIVPKEYVGAVMELNNDRRGRFDHLEYLSEDRVHLIYELPLAEIVLDYYDQLKSRTRGYASFDYDLSGFERASSCAWTCSSAASRSTRSRWSCTRTSRTAAARRSWRGCARRSRGRCSTCRSRRRSGRAMIARETVKARRKDVLAKCYGGDITRKRKLLEKQKAGKKRMKQVGAVEVPQEAFLAVLNLGRHERDERRPAPLRAPAVLRASVRLLRLRHGRRARRRARRATSTRCSRELELERGVLAASSRRSSSAAARRRSPSRARSRVCWRAAGARGGDRRGESETVTPELAALLRDERRHARVAGCAELHAAAPRRARARRQPDDVRRAVLLSA